ncbi:MAG: VIT domain-containing protein, partial [Allosphingosinicella sp.]
MSRRLRSRSTLSLLASLLIGTAFSGPAFAQSAGPALIARVAGINSEATESRKLRIDALDIDVRINGTIAETTITARFANPGSQNLEGEFTLAMPTGSVVTGYALDVNGRMIEGVLADQRQARIAYEARVRQRIDPGLGEVGRDNVFRTRIFPIMPGSGRTIRLRFSTPLDPRQGYVLPLRGSDEIGALSVRVTAAGVSRPPALSIPGQSAARWTSGAGNHVFALERRQVRLDGDLEVAPPQPAAPLLVSRHANGQRFFQIADAAAAPAADAAPARSVAILWDRSLSRADDDLAEEMAILGQYLDRVRPQTIDLILFDSGGAERVRVRDAADLLARLRSVTYRGATSLAVLADTRLTGTDACLLFSDGLVTIDPSEGVRADCPLFALSSANDANRAFLASLARGSGGESYDLSVREAGEVLSRMTRRVPRVVDVRSSGGARVDFSLLDGGENGWRMVGPMPASGDIIVRLSGLGTAPTERLYSATGALAETSGPGALWAAERVAIRAAGDEL